MIRQILLLIFIGLIVTACGKTSADYASPTYDKLCEIYKGIDAQPLEYGMKELKLTEKIQKQLPEFFKRHFVNISTVDIDRKYELIKKLAEMESGSGWECPAIITYYEGVDGKKK